MALRTIPQREWCSFCESFTRQHHGWLVTVHVTDGARDRVLAAQSPLEEVRCVRDDRLAVVVDDGRDEGSFFVAGVVKLEERGVNGAHAGLRIEDDHGRAYHVDFRVPALSEEVDGMADVEL